MAIEQFFSEAEVALKGCGHEGGVSHRACELRVGSCRKKLLRKIHIAGTDSLDERSHSVGVPNVSLCAGTKDSASRIQISLTHSLVHCNVARLRLALRRSNWDPKQRQNEGEPPRGRLQSTHKFAPKWLNSVTLP